MLMSLLNILFIDFRERGKEREQERVRERKNIGLLFHLFADWFLHVP